MALCKDMRQVYADIRPVPQRRSRGLIRVPKINDLAHTERFVRLRQARASFLSAGPSQDPNWSGSATIGQESEAKESVRSDSTTFSERLFVRLRGSSDSGARDLSGLRELRFEGQVPRATLQRHTVSEAWSSSTSSHGRGTHKHAMYYGQLIPAVSSAYNSTFPDSARSHCPTALPYASERIAVGARPLLQTVQGFPFDL